MVYRSIGTDEVSWGGRTYPETRDVAETNGSVFVLPVGNVEQHGYHLPTATDTLLADAVAQHGAERVADDLPVSVAPLIWTGYSPHCEENSPTGEIDDPMLATPEKGAALFDLLLNERGRPHATPRGESRVTSTRAP